MGNRAIGMILLAVYLILVGLATAFSIALPPLVTGLIALAAGVLLLLPLVRM